jgi:hypothetical protein
MNAGDTVELQVRLLLERQCAELGRWLAGQLRGLPFVLFLVDFGEEGNVAFIATDDACPRAVRSFLDRGVVPERAPTAASAAELQEAARALATDIGARCPAGVAFAALFYNTRPNCILYLSSANREDMRRLLEEWLALREPAASA